ETHGETANIARAGAALLLDVDARDKALERCCFHLRHAALGQFVRDGEAADEALEPYPLRGSETRLLGRSGVGGGFIYMHTRDSVDIVAPLGACRAGRERAQGGKENSGKRCQRRKFHY